MDNITIAVTSGKGGTGKTTVATNLACSINAPQFLDCDVEDPNAHLFLNPVLQRTEPVLLPLPVVDYEKCIQCGKCVDFCEYNALALVKDKIIVFSELCHACGGCSIVCPVDAISEQDRSIGIVEFGQAGDMKLIDGLLEIGEAVAPPIIKAVKSKSDKNLLTILDSPPGTGCPMVESINGCDFALLVTEPTPFGLNDLALATEVVKKLEIPAGVVINRSDENDAETEEYCKEQEIPVLMKIPMDRSIAEAYSEGKMLIDVKPKWKDKFNKLFDDIKRMLTE